MFEVALWVFLISMFTLPALEVEEDLLVSVLAAFNKSLWLALLLDLFDADVFPPVAFPPLFKGSLNRSDVEDDVPECSF